MDLKETKQLIASSEIKLHTKSKNKSDTQEMYDALFSDEEQLGETNTDSKPVSYTHLTLPTICSV